MASVGPALRLEHVAEIEGQHRIGGVGAHRRGVEALGRGVIAARLGLVGLDSKIVEAARLLLRAHRQAHGELARELGELARDLAHQRARRTLGEPRLGEMAAAPPQR